jgi:NHL repeat-containing protein
MSKTMTVVVAMAAGIGVGAALGGRFIGRSAAAQTAATAASFSAVPTAVGAEDISGPYDVVEGWPKDLATLPGHEKWTYGGARGIFAESPNRVYLLGGGELPNLPRPQARQFPELGPNVIFPIAGLPWRNANTAAPPGAGGSGQDPAQGMALWRGSSPPYRELGVDARWEHCLIVVDAQGNIIEEWTQWDKMFKRPHAVYVSPYDAEKHVWVVDDHTHAIYKFTHDGKQLVQTIGTPNVPGADATHFNRPTFIAWMPDGSFYVSDGYNGTRVAKFDVNGKFLFDFGKAGERGGKESRPGYMNNFHGVAIDLQTRRVFVNDRDNHRIQIFDENGKYLSEWKIAVSPSSLHLVQIGADRTLVTFDRNTHKMLKYDLDGRLLYAWGTVADFPGTLWGVHGFSTDQEGNLYVAEVDAGRFQKFRPRPGSNPAMLVGKPVYSAWQ